MELKSRLSSATYLLLSQTSCSTQEVAYLAPEGDSLLSLLDDPSLGHRRSVPSHWSPRSRTSSSKLMSIAGGPPSLLTSALTGQSDPTGVLGLEQGWN